MSKTVTEWKRPPVVEVVLGVQFSPLRRLHNGLLGLFWREMMADYPKASDAAPIAPAIEEFGDEPQFAMPGIEFAPARGDSRLRMVSADASRMIQVQNGWLVANWMKKQGQPYPGYEGVQRQFDQALNGFKAFAAEHELGAFEPSVWEVTYIDHIPRNTVWSDFADIPSVVPGLLGGPERKPGAFEAFSGTWSYRLADMARMRVVLQTARSNTDPPLDLLVVTSTVRGPITDSEPGKINAAMNSGHAAAVETFVAITSRKAREYWEGKHG